MHNGFIPLKFFVKNILRAKAHTKFPTMFQNEK